MDLHSYSQAELELFVNDANVHRQFLLNLNDGAFVSAIQTSKRDFMEQAKTSGGESSYMKLGMMIFSGLGTEKMSAEKMISELAKVAPAIDDPNISFRRKYYLKLPLSSLRKGKNSVSISVINSPTSYIALNYLISIKLRLR